LGKRESWDGMGYAKKPGSGESNPKFDRARMLRHTTEKGTPVLPAPRNKPILFFHGLP